MNGDGQFDYQTLTKAQIEYALGHIDGLRFPLNLANARAALEARNSGASPEPAPLLDAATDAKYTYWVEKLLAALIAAYAAIGLSINDLMIPFYGHSRAGLIHLRGPAAWIGALALFLFATIPFFGGLTDKEQSDRLEIVPRFRYIFGFAILLVILALIANVLGPERLAIVSGDLGGHLK